MALTGVGKGVPPGVLAREVSSGEPGSVATSLGLGGAATITDDVESGVEAVGVAGAVARRAVDGCGRRAGVVTSVEVVDDDGVGGPDSIRGFFATGSMTLRARAAAKAIKAATRSTGAGLVISQKVAK